MKTLCFYISDYGYGHASRSIALIREIVAFREDIRVFVRTSGPFVFTQQSLVHPRIMVLRCRNDPIIPLCQNSYEVDRKKTLTIFLKWMESWDDYIKQECTFCTSHNIDLILSDITPQAFRVAEILGIPSIAVSNFSWDLIYRHLFPDLSEIDNLRDAYCLASCACILPFNIGMEIFPCGKPVSLISRTVTVSRKTMRKNLGIRDDEILLFIGGISSPVSFSSIMPHIRKTDAGIRFVTSSGCDHHGTIPIPPEETESQNWLGMCDGILTKCGYSTVSEAVHAKIPLVIWKREGFIEDEAIAGTIEKLGIGRIVHGPEEAISYSLENYSSLQKYKESFDRIDGIYQKNGFHDIMRILGRMMA